MANERWQYNVVDVKGSVWTMKIDAESLKNELNKLGQAGWELMWMKQVSGAVQLVLKRPL
jgi:hypothetical protein